MVHIAALPAAESAVAASPPYGPAETGPAESARTLQMCPVEVPQIAACEVTPPGRVNPVVFSDLSAQYESAKSPALALTVGVVWVARVTVSGDQANATPVMSPEYV